MKRNDKTDLHSEFKAMRERNAANTPAQTDAAFTGGDWKVSGLTYLDEPIEINRAGDIICNVVFTDVPRTEAEANARLIAEAKNLFKMVETFINILDPLINNPAHENVMTEAKAILSRIKNK